MARRLRAPAPALVLGGGRMLRRGPHLGTLLNAGQDVGLAGPGIEGLVISAAVGPGDPVAKIREMALVPDGTLREGDRVGGAVRDRIDAIGEVVEGPSGGLAGCAGG